MYIVHNTTNKPISLIDLRISIDPLSIVDLETITDISSIEKSYCLKKELKGKTLQLIRHSVVNSSVNIDKKIQLGSLKPNVVNEDKIIDSVKKVIAEEVNKIKNNNNSAEELFQYIKNKIDSINTNPNNTSNNNVSNQDINIDPSKIAEITQKGIEQISKQIEGSSSSKAKKVQIINPSLIDLAKEI